MTVTAGDLLAALDIVTELLNECDELPVDLALALQDALGQLLSETKRADAMMTTTIKRHLESGTKRIGERDYALRKTGKSRFRHGEIGMRVARTAAATEDGRMRSPLEAAQEAVRLMTALYVSPSDQPSVGGLDAIGLTRKEASDWEWTGSEVVITDLSTPEGSQ